MTNDVRDEDLIDPSQLVNHEDVVVRDGVQYLLNQGFCSDAVVVPDTAGIFSLLEKVSGDVADV